MPAILSPARLHLLFLLGLAFATSFFAPITLPLRDAFHEGEYAVLGYLARATADFRMPVLTHGGMDFMPSWIAATTCSAEYQIVCVRFVNTIIHFAASVLFLATLVAITGLGTTIAWLASIPAIAAIWLYNGTAYSMVAAHHGAPGVRDVMLLGGLAIIAWLSRTSDRLARAAAAPAWIGLGIVSALSPFWTYNRGIVLIAAAGLFALGTLAIRRSVMPMAWMTLGGIAGLGLVLALGGTSYLVDTLNNILYWHRNAGIWVSTIHPQNIPPLVLLTMAVLGGGAITARALIRSGRREECLLLAILGLTFVLYLWQSLTRPDLWHLRWVQVPATLTLAVTIRHWAERTIVEPLPRLSRSFAAFLILSAACVETYSDKSVLRVVMGGFADNLRALRAPLPNDRALVGEDISRVADLIRARDRCAFVANNAGIVHLLSRTGPCSRFMFSIYIAPRDQQEVIDALNARRPSLILWDSPAFYARFDNRGIRERQPILAAWIETNYPVRTSIGDLTILSREELPR